MTLLISFWVGIAWKRFLKWEHQWPIGLFTTTKNKTNLDKNEVDEPRMHDFLVPIYMLLHSKHFYFALLLIISAACGEQVSIY